MKPTSHISSSNNPWLVAFNGPDVKVSMDTGVPPLNEFGIEEQKVVDEEEQTLHQTQRQNNSRETVQRYKGFSFTKFLFTTNMYSFTDS